MPMSDDLPFWNENETDVKIEYRLQFGHVLLLHNDFDFFLKKLQNVFKLKKPVNIFETLDTQVLPYHQNTYLLNDEHKWHIVYAKFENNVATVHAPHFLFFNNSKWIKLSELLKSFVIVSEQFDRNLFHYTIFKNGKLLCNAYRDPEGIHKSTHAPVNVYFNNEIIFHKEDDSKDLIPEIIEIISSDAVLIGNVEKGIKLLSPIKNHEIQPTSVCHLVFEVNDK